MSAAIRCARELLAAWTVAQYLDERRAGSGAQHGRFKKSAICVDPSDTLGGILSTLARHDILSAPVVEKTSGRYSGFVDVAGILSIFVKSCRHWLCREYGSGMVRRLALSIHPSSRRASKFDGWIWQPRVICFRVSPARL